MIAATTFSGQRVALFGLGGSGLATCAALAAGGANVAAWDDQEAARMKAQAAGVALTDLHAADWGAFSALVLAPGVPLSHPVPHWTVVAAQAAGIEIIGDIEIFCRERARRAPSAPFVAITATNGKSTTTALIAHLFKTLGRDVQMGGNIGTPILSLAPFDAERVYVIEISSFQIDLAPSLAPSVGVVLNITPDHLDRHGDMARYAAIKERLAAASDCAVIAVDDHYTREIAERRLAAEKPTTLVSITSPLLSDGYVAENGGVALREHGVSRAFVDLADVGALRGAHNAQNAAAALAAVLTAVLAAPATGAAAHAAPAFAQAAAGVRTFAGLAHRMEEVGRCGRALFINDSKATNADAAEKALLSFRDIFWIAGGLAKSGGVAPLRPLFSRMVKAYLIGEAAPAFAATLAGEVAYEHCGDLETAVRRAGADALAHTGAPVVLLSPACASFDQFPNFEKRGDAFRAAARAFIASQRDPSIENGDTP